MAIFRVRTRDNHFLVLLYLMQKGHLTFQVFLLEIFRYLYTRRVRFALRPTQLQQMTFKIQGNIFGNRLRCLTHIQLNSMLGLLGGDSQRFKAQIWLNKFRQHYLPDSSHVQGKIPSQAFTCFLVQYLATEST